PQERPLRVATVAELEQMDFAAGSMGPKVQAGCDFVRKHDGRAVIGRLSDLGHLLDGTSGTTILR
ncbi:MAG: carbamate kinase, partial [Acidipropionibacterium jensenii]|nr:carbamate kinase [Acidipropionibacterium jensenii]